MLFGIADSFIDALLDLVFVFRKLWCADESLFPLVDEMSLELFRVFDLLNFRFLP